MKKGKVFWWIVMPESYQFYELWLMQECRSFKKEREFSDVMTLQQWCRDHGHHKYKVIQITKTLYLSHNCIGKEGLQ